MARTILALVLFCPPYFFLKAAISCNSTLFNADTTTVTSGLAVCHDVSGLRQHWAWLRLRQQTAYLYTSQITSCGLRCSVLSAGHGRAEETHEPALPIKTNLSLILATFFFSADTHQAGSPLRGKA